jgi:ferredoxin
VKLQIDRDTCDGFGLCAMDVPEHVDFDDDELKASVTAPELPEGLTETIQRVVANCPVRAISVVD